MANVRITLPVAYNVAGSRVGGINLNDEPVRLNGQFSPFMRNMVVERTRVRKFQGYSRLGTGEPMSGIGCELVNYTDAAGLLHLIALTTTRAYEYDGSSDSWEDITEVKEEEPVEWSGDEDDVFSYDIVTDPAMFINNGGSALCVVNNVDDIKYYEGDAGDKFSVLQHTFPSFASCRELCEFWNHFFVFGWTDSSTRARSLAFSGFADVDDWTGATAGVTTLTDTVGALLKVAKLGDELVIYSEKTISLGRYIGGYTLYVFPVLAQALGLLSQRAVSNTPRAHFFLGTDLKVYALFKGGSPVDVGRAVDSVMFAGLDISNKARIACGYDSSKQRVFFALPSAGEVYPRKLYAVYTNLDGNPWEFFEFKHDVRGFGVLKRTKSSAYCDDNDWKDVYCNETPAYCDDMYGFEGADMTCFITSDGYVFKLDESTGYFDEEEIDCEYQTEDIVLEDEEDFGRFVWFSFTGKSAIEDVECDVYYSVDGGENWEALADSPVVLETSWKTHRLPLDVVSRTIRFRLVQRGFGDLQLRSNFRIEAQVSPSRD